MLFIVTFGLSVAPIKKTTGHFPVSVFHIVPVSAVLRQLPIYSYSETSESGPSLERTVPLPPFELPIILMH
jgi:hypothetical protein